MTRSFIYATVVAISACAAVPALASERVGGKPAGVITSGDWLSFEEIAARLTAKGYRIKEIELDDGLYEVEVRSERGGKSELYVDPRSGNILRRDDD